VCTAGCGDGVLGGSEACDDGNASAGDGCSADCRYEPLCLVTLDGGAPAQASVVKVSPDGSLAHVSDTVLPGNSASSLSVARCGRHVYMNLAGAVAGFDVGLDGALTPLTTISTALADVGRLACTPAGNLLFVIQNGVFLVGQMSSYTVAPDGTLTPAHSDGGGNPSGGRVFADFHPVTGDLYLAGSYVAQGPGPDIPTAYVERLTYDVAGNFSLAEQQYLTPGAFTPVALGGIRFTEDAGVLAVPGYSENGVACFGHYTAPGTTIPPLANFNKTCTSPFPGDFRAMVPRPEGGSLFYLQTGVALHAAEFSGAAVVSDASIVPVHEASELLLAFDGHVLVSLSPVAGEVATYDVAPDLVTLTPNDTEPVAPGPGGGLLLPCPGL
jgi:cysteine-rich repeat protein